MDTTQTLKFGAILSIMAKRDDIGPSMKSMSARDAKNGFGLLLDTARAEPVTIEKHGRPVVIVMSVEEYDRLASGRNTRAQPDKKRNKNQKMLKEAR